MRSRVNLEWVRVRAALLTALESFPDARLAVSRVLVDLGQDDRRNGRLH
jgi:hypothetical protein